MIVKRYNDFFFFSKEESKDEYPTLPAGVYTVKFIGMFDRAPMFTPKASPEKYIEPMASEPYVELKGIMNKFFNKKLMELYLDMKYLNKTGIICHGKPGTGKTASIDCLLQQVAAKYNAIVLYINDKEAIANMENLVIILRKEVKQDIPIVFVIDECENHFGDHYTENAMLHFLDGFKSKNNVLSIFITNKLDMIPDRFKDRPSRIKACIEFSKAPYEVLKQVLTEKIPVKYHKMIDIEKLAYTYSEEGKTIDEAKSKVIGLLEDAVIKEAEAVVLEN